MVTGAGVGGWAYPDLPIVGSMVQRILGDTAAQGTLSPGLNELKDIAGQIAQGHGARRGDSAHAATTTAESASPGRMVSTRSARFAPVSDTITIASYNIQVLGESKLAKPHVMNYLVQIMRRFDLVAIQEVRSKNDAVIPGFVQLINADGHRYDYVIGPRLGRTDSKEQYAFVFNTDRIEVDPSSVLTVHDPADSLHREPLLARFRARTPDPVQGFTFWLMNAHTDPDEVPEEIAALAGAFVSVQQQGWGEDDVILLGDLNASEKELGHLGALPAMRYAIAGLPTNTRGNKTYDNILFDGRTTTEFSGQAGVGNVMQVFGLTLDQALEISDHLPVWAAFSAYEGGSIPQIARQPGNAPTR
jgi:endonuclease/exonuclease/phosphatase family metal-dependent hydrolase